MNRKARCCCGIDVHKASLSVCLRLHGKGRKVGEEIGTFGTTGDELLALHDWLKEHDATEVAMEATGVYWKPVCYVLEDGFRVILVNPAEIKRMAGRKTDVSDCAWLAQLLDNGMSLNTVAHPLTAFLRTPSSTSPGLPGFSGKSPAGEGRKGGPTPIEDRKVICGTGH